MEHGIAGPEADGLAEVLQSAIVLLKIAVCGAAVCIGLREVRVQTNRLIEITNGRFILFEELVAIPAAIVASRVGGTDPYDLVTVLQTQLVLLQITPGLSAAYIGFDVIRTGAQSVIETPRSFDGLVLIQQNDGFVIRRFGVV